MSAESLSPERQAAAQEYTRRVQAYISLARVAFNRSPYCDGGYHADDELPESKNG